jgi:hypothetical protein
VRRPTGVKERMSPCSGLLALNLQIQSLAGISKDKLPDKLNYYINI